MKKSNGKFPVTAVLSVERRNAILPKRGHQGSIRPSSRIALLNPNAAPVNRTNKPIEGLKIELVFHDGGEWNIPNTLLIDEEYNLYLETTGQDGEGIWIAGQWNSVEQVREGDIEPVPIADALDWYARSAEYAGGYDGTPQTLCGLAADVLKAGGAR